MTNDCFVVAVARFRRINNQSATLFCLCASVSRVARPDDVRIPSAFPSLTPVRACPFLVVQLVSRSQHTLELFCFVLKVCNSMRYSWQCEFADEPLPNDTYNLFILQSRLVYVYNCPMRHDAHMRDTRRERDKCVSMGYL